MTTATSTPAGRAVVYGNDPRLEQNATAKFAAKRADAQRAADALNGAASAPVAPVAPPAEKMANITIEVAPDGLHIRAEYTGPIGSIPAAIERLKAAGVLDLVQASRVAPAVAPVAPAAGVVEKFCPVHGDPMKPMAKPDRKGNTHWCTKKAGEGFCTERL